MTICFHFQPLAVKRPTWAAKRPNYTDLGVSMRCVKGDDQSISVSHKFPVLDTLLAYLMLYFSFRDFSFSLRFFSI